MIAQLQFRIVQISSSFYRLLIQAYPAEFRADYANEMAWFFEDACRDALQQHGLWSVGSLWLRTLLDWAITVTKERALPTHVSPLERIDTHKFNQQFQSTLALFSRALRGGYSVQQAFEILTEHAPEPTRTTFVEILARMRQGIDLQDVLSAVAKDLESNYFRLMVMSLIEQRQQGGNLANRLDTLREDFQAELEDNGWAIQVDLNDDYPMN